LTGGDCVVELHLEKVENENKVNVKLKLTIRRPKGRSCRVRHAAMKLLRMTIKYKIRSKVPYQPMMSF